MNASRGLKTGIEEPKMPFTTLTLYGCLYMNLEDILLIRVYSRKRNEGLPSWRGIIVTYAEREVVHHQSEYFSTQPSKDLCIFYSTCTELNISFTLLIDI